MPFIEKHRPINPETAVLEIGCGEGGNLMPFAKRGCDVTGIDISEERIKQATDFFSAENLKGHFARENILSYNTLSVERETVCTI